MKTIIGEVLNNFFAVFYSAPKNQTEAKGFEGEKNSSGEKSSGGYIIKAPDLPCPEGTVKDHTGKCRPIWE